MKAESLSIMKELVILAVRLFGLGNEPITVLDVGSLDVDGNFRQLFKETDHYVGIDIKDGINVDIVVDPLNWHNVPDHYFDLVITGCTFEYVKYGLPVMEQIARKMKGQSVFCILVSCAPDHIHDCPGDYRRYLPDGLKALAEWANLIPIKTRLEPEGYWRFCSMLATKGLSTTETFD